MTTPTDNVLDPRSRAFYARTMQLLRDADVPFLLGGAYAFARYTGIERHTKDLDVFVRPEDAQRTLAVLAEAGFHTEVAFPFWLAKAHHGEDFVDLIYSSGNGIGTVDDAWFEHAAQDVVFGVPVRLCPPEEMIWHKAFVMERERFDGADVAHLLLARGAQLDWPRLLARFGPYWRVLLSHLILFGFIYPDRRDQIPAGVLQGLLDRLAEENTGEQIALPSGERVCRGTLISRAQYLPDVREWGYRDGRLTDGLMSASDVDDWSEAIDDT